MEEDFEKIVFEEVDGSENQLKILFDLLKKREFKISHEKMPSFENHKNFVLNNPYSKWFIIYNNDNEFGTFYIKQDNSIGLNLIANKKEVVKKTLEFIDINFEPNKSKASEIPSYFYFNLSILNSELRNIFQEMGKEPFQISYKL